MNINDLDGDDGPATGRKDARIAWLEARVQELEAALASAQAAPPHLHPSPAATDRWSETGYPLLERGQGAGIGYELPMDDFLATGWWPVENWGVWGRDGNHSLRFHIPNHSHGYVGVHLTLRTFVAPGHERPRIAITANGYFLGHFHIGTKAQKLSLKLPPSSIDKGDVILAFEHSAPHSPASLGVGEDCRPLGVGFIALSLP